MRFFEKQRVELFFHGGKLFRDGKTGERRWRINLVITLKGAEVASGCDETITSNYLALETRENCIEEIKIAKDVPPHDVGFFSLQPDQTATLRLGRCELTELKMTRVDGLSELWIKVEHKCTDVLHAFVKDYAFQRFWAEFVPCQPLLPMDEKPVAVPKGGSKTVN